MSCTQAVMVEPSCPRDPTRDLLELRLRHLSATALPGWRKQHMAKLQLARAAGAVVSDPAGRSDVRSATSVDADNSVETSSQCVAA